MTQMPANPIDRLPYIGTEAELDGFAIGLDWQGKLTAEAKEMIAKRQQEIGRKAK